MAGFHIGGRGHETRSGDGHKSWNQSSADSQEEQAPQFCNQVEVNSANSLNELRNRLTSRASRRECSHVTP